MSTTAPGGLQALEDEYRARVAAVRGDSSLSWEKKERKVRELGLAYDRARREAEQEAA